MEIDSTELAAIQNALAGAGVTEGNPSPQKETPKPDARAELERVLVEHYALYDGFPAIRALKTKMPALPVAEMNPKQRAQYELQVKQYFEAVKPIGLAIQKKVDALLRPGGKELSYDDTMAVVVREIRAAKGEFEEALKYLVAEPTDQIARLMMANKIGSTVMREELSTLQQKIGLEKTAELLNAPLLPNRNPRLNAAEMETAMQMEGRTWLTEALQNPNPATQFNLMLYAGANPNLPGNEKLFPLVSGLELKSARQVMNKGQTNPINLGLLPVIGEEDGKPVRLNRLNLGIDTPGPSGDPTKLGDTPLVQVLEPVSAVLPNLPRQLGAGYMSAMVGLASKDQLPPIYRMPGGGKTQGMMAGAQMAMGGFRRTYPTGPNSLTDTQYFVIESLLQAGADPDLVSGKNVNLVRDAANRNDPLLVDLMAKYEANLDYVYREPPQQIMVEGAPITLDGAETSPLVIALEKFKPNNATVTEEERKAQELRMRADLNYVPPVPQRIRGVLEALVENGANPYQLDSDGRTPFMSVVEDEGNGYREEAMRAFKDACAKKGVDVVNMTDRDGKTALQRVMELGSGISKANWAMMMTLVNMDARTHLDIEVLEEDKEGIMRARKVLLVDFVREQGVLGEIQPMVFFAAKGLGISKEECVETLMALATAEASGEGEDVSLVTRERMETRLAEFANTLYQTKKLTAQEAETLGATQPALDRQQELERRTKPLEETPVYIPNGKQSVTFDDIVPPAFSKRDNLPVTGRG